MSIKHLRISCEHKNVNHVLNSFISKFKPIKWFAAYENKNKEECEYKDYIVNEHSNCKLIHNEEEETNPHIQALMVYNIEPSKQSVSDFFKKMPILKNKDESGKNIAGYYHKEINKTEEDNIIYMLKDGHIISYGGYTEKEIIELNKKSEIINEDKKLTSKEKLYNRWVKLNGLRYPKSKYELYIFIDETYILEWNKSALAAGHRNCYSMYIMAMIHKNIEKKNQLIYTELTKSIYNINEVQHLMEENLIREEPQKPVIRKKGLKQLLKMRKSEGFIDSDSDIEYI